ncbi:type IIL restriction-modification enzyme MmeI [Vibrio parahaemolyticus]
MPSELKLAHERLDKYMDSIYGLSGKVMEVDRVATLFKLYADMTEKENA